MTTTTGSIRWTGPLGFASVALVRSAPVTTQVNGIPSRTRPARFAVPALTKPAY